MNKDKHTAITTIVAVIFAGLAISMLSSCAPGNQLENYTPQTVVVCKEISGFWPGFLHGFLLEVSWLGHLIDGEIGLYDACNNGGWYNCGSRSEPVLCLASSVASSVPWHKKARMTPSDFDRLESYGRRSRVKDTNGKVLAMIETNVYHQQDRERIEAYLAKHKLTLEEFDIPYISYLQDLERVLIGRMPNPCWCGPYCGTGEVVAINPKCPHCSQYVDKLKWDDAYPNKVRT